MIKYMIHFMMVLFTLGIQSAYANKTISIGVILNNSGAAQKVDIYHLNVLNYAIEQINRTGGIHHHKIQLKPLYGDSTSLGAKAAAKQAINNDIVAIIGPPQSSHALAAAQVLQNAQIPMITPLATNPDVTAVGDYIFRTSFTDTFQGKVLGNFASNDLKVKTAVILTTPRNIYSENLGNRFNQEFTANGGTVLKSFSYVENVTNFKEIAQQVNSLSPELIFIPGYPIPASSFINAYRKISSQSIFLGADGWGEMMIKYSKNSMENSYYSAHWHPMVNTIDSQQFVQQYEKEFGQIRYRSIGNYYDTIQLLFKAIELAKSISSTSIKSALLNLKPYKGITGTIQFDKNGDTKKPIVILKYKGTHTAYVKRIMP